MMIFSIMRIIFESCLLFKDLRNVFNEFLLGLGEVAFLSDLSNFQAGRRFGAASEIPDLSSLDVGGEFPFMGKDKGDIYGSKVFTLVED
jgi:hypothetical protein